MERVLRHLADGASSVEEAASLIGSLSGMTQIVEAERLEERIAALEAQTTGDRGAGYTGASRGTSPGSPVTRRHAGAWPRR